MGGPWLKQIVINTYAKERTELRVLNETSDTSLASLPHGWNVGHWIHKLKHNYQSWVTGLFGTQASEVCLRLLDRIGELDNWEQIQNGSVDPLFPPNASSVAPAGKQCGDAAHGIHESCDKFQNWDTISDVMSRWA